MATARETIEAALRGEGCLGKAHPDEPVFVLRARDVTADDFVRRWAARVGERLGMSHPKVTSAIEIVRAMRAWPDRKLPD